MGMMKVLVTPLLLLASSRSSPLAEPDDYQYDESDSQEEAEEADIDIQIISPPMVEKTKIGEKVVLPCRVEPEGQESKFNRIWDRPDSGDNQQLAIGENIMHDPEEFAVEGNTLIILKEESPNHSNILGHSLYLHLLLLFLL